MATATTDQAQARRTELILRQIDSLPTLPAVAVRLLALTTSSQSDARQVTQIISADAALTAKVLSMCRRADLGVNTDNLTIDKAVVLLGFTSIRNAVLSIKVFEMFQGKKGAPASRCDRKAMWRHSLAVAVAAEQIVLAHPRQPDLDSGQAFVCGLLHDIGKLALDYVLPKSFDRVIELVELNQGDIAEFERRIVGLDHHTAGKRLAEQWQLPHLIQDCIWLHGSVHGDMSAVPHVDHRRMIGVIALADLVVRKKHIGYSGNYLFNQDVDALAGVLGLDARIVNDATHHLHEELERRCAELGVDATPSSELLLESIMHANHMLGQVNGQLERRSRTAARQTQTLDAITAFHSTALPGRSVESVLGQVVVSAATVLGNGFYAMFYQPAPGEPWLICQYNRDGVVTHSQLVDPPSHAPQLANLDASDPTSLNLMSVLPWALDYLVEAPDVRELRALPLGCGWGTAAIMMHDRPMPGSSGRELASLMYTWGSAIASAGQHDGARRLGEELAQVNRDLALAQDKLTQTESLVRVGEMAAGAAHEMNNPLAVISGRAQLLSQSLQAHSREYQSVQTIIEQSHRISDLITSLRLFADPPAPHRRPTDLSRLLESTVKQVQNRYHDKTALKPTDVRVYGAGQAVNVDPEHFTLSVTELLHNAYQAVPRTGVQVSARVSADATRLTVEVSDDGHGMDAHTLEHALDPFFSNKPAGRRVGMGLPRARQMATAHGGDVMLRSVPGKGTTATVTFQIDPS